MQKRKTHLQNGEKIYSMICSNIIRNSVSKVEPLKTLDKTYLKFWLHLALHFKIRSNDICVSSVCLNLTCRISRFSKLRSTSRYLGLTSQMLPLGLSTQCCSSDGSRPKNCTRSSKPSWWYKNDKSLPSYQRFRSVSFCFFFGCTLSDRSLVASI